MTQEHLNPEQLAVYAKLIKDNKLYQLPKEIAEHVESCDLCVSEAIELSMILDETENIEIGKSKFEIKNNNYKYLKIAASVLLPVALVLATVLLVKNNNEQITKNEKTIINGSEKSHKTKKVYLTEKSDSIDSEKKQGKKIVKTNNEPQKLLACYVPDKNMEKLIKNFDGNLRGNAIKIISKQELKVKANQKFILEWENPENIELTVELFDNTGKSIESEDTSGNNYPIKKKLKPALFYWKLYTQDFDLLYCGKIIVE